MLVNAVINIGLSCAYLSYYQDLGSLFIGFDSSHIKGDEYRLRVGVTLQIAKESVVSIFNERYEQYVIVSFGTYFRLAVVSNTHLICEGFLSTTAPS